MSPSVASERGFTLIEALASVLILSVALAALMPTMVDGLRRIDYSNERMLAAEIAQSLLDRAGVDPDLRATEGGAEGGFSWRVEKFPFGQSSDREAWIYDPQRILVTITWGGGAHSIQVSRLTLPRKANT